MEELVVRAGTRDDLAAVARVQAECPEAADWPVQDYLTYCLDVAVRDGQLVGFLVTRRLVEGESEVLNVAVARSARRQGVGRRLLQAAFARWPGAWFLEVRESNVVARACYRHLGFQEVGIRSGYYQNSPEGGIVMVKEQ